MKEDLLGYVLNLSEPNERERIERRLQKDPNLRCTLTVCWQALSPLALDRDGYEPPADLSQRTIDYVFRQMDILESDTVPAPSARLQALVEALDRKAMSDPSRWRRWDVAAVACMLVLAIGLGLAALPLVRQRQERIACQNQMRELHLGLEMYCDLHAGQYPQLREEPPFNTAAAVAPLLQEAGVVPTNVNFTCPANPMLPATYAYTLGYREPDGRLAGLSRNWIADSQQFLPILADRPLERVGHAVSPEHRYGQNVLFVDGHVRFCTSTRVGVGGDEIYINKFGLVAAGVHRHDTVLGFGGDHP